MGGGPKIWFLLLVLSTCSAAGVHFVCNAQEGTGSMPEDAIANTTDVDQLTGGDDTNMTMPQFSDSGEPEAIRYELVGRIIKDAQEDQTDQISEGFEFVGEADPASQPVTVDNEYFIKNGRPFNFIGFNQYYMLEQARSEETRSLVDEVLRDAQKLGMTVMRTWAFGETENGLQPKAGEFNEEVFQALDYVIDTSAKYNIHLILAIVNYWPEFGGMESYVKWCTGSTSIEGLSVSEFYNNPLCQQMYKNTMQTLMNRNNTINGRVYKNDPTILGWDLANEPRNPGDLSADVLTGWLYEMSNFAKMLSPTQLVTTGMEGLFGLSTPTLAMKGNPGVIEWKYWTCQGTDFIRQHDLPSIDFTVAHLYPDSWVNKDCNGAGFCKELFASRWVDTHIEQSKKIGKPFVLEEFGTSTMVDGSYDTDLVNYREDIFETVFTELEHAASVAELGTGALFWTFSSIQYPDYDGFTIYHGSQSDPVDDVVDDEGNYNKRKRTHYWQTLGTISDAEENFRNKKELFECLDVLERDAETGMIATRYRALGDLEVSAQDSNSSNPHGDTVLLAYSGISLVKGYATLATLPVASLANFLSLHKFW